MHDRAAKPTGAVKSAAAIAIEIMILLNINLRIAQVRPRVEKRVHRLPAVLARCSVRCPKRIAMARPAFSAETAPNAFGATAAGFRLHFYEDFARKETRISFNKKERTL